MSGRSRGCGRAYRDVGLLEDVVALHQGLERLVRVLVLALVQWPAHLKTTLATSQQFITISTLPPKTKEGSFKRCQIPVQPHMTVHKPLLFHKS
jgi:hypothetical protein